MVTRTTTKGETLSGEDLNGTPLPMISHTLSLAKMKQVCGKGSFIEAIGTVRIEKIVVLGLEKSPKSIKVGEESIPFVWNSGVGASGSIMGGKSSELIVKDPKVLLVQDWQIHFE
jgi:hypothetical protein